MAAVRALLERWRQRSRRHRAGGTIHDDGSRLDLDILLAQRAAALPLAPRFPTAAPLAGGTRARQQGRGLDFDELRAYQPGDDARAIDWRVTARTGRPHTRLYREERERPLQLLVDLRPNMLFGTRGALKSVQAGKTAALLAWAAADRGDRVGGLVFGAAGFREQPPRGGRRGPLPLLGAIAALHGEPGSMPPPGSLALVLARLRHVARPGSLLVLISDFRGLDGDAERHLNHLTRHHEMVAIQVYDPLEAAPPPPGRYAVSDGAAALPVDLRRQDMRDAWGADFARHNAHVIAAFTRRRVHLLRLATHNAPADSVRRVLEVRAGMHHARGLRGRAG